MKKKPVSFFGTLFFVLFSCLFFTGCLNRYVSVIGRKNGLNGDISIPVNEIGTTGNLSINLGGKIFKGTWVWTANGHNFILFGNERAGTGKAVLQADDGSTLHCDFIYSNQTATGSGTCEDDQDFVYDVQIT